MALVVAGKEIEGVLACPPVSTGQYNEDGEPRAQWFTMELYALSNGGWLVHRTGWSVVYHKIDTTCVTRVGRKRGDPAGVDDLPDDAMPCRACRPPYPEDIPDGPGTIRFEFPRHSWDACPSPEIVYVRLTTVRSRDGGVSEYVSAPVDELLRNAAAIYPEFAPLLAA